MLSIHSSSLLFVATKIVTVLVLLLPLLLHSITIVITFISADLATTCHPVPLCPAVCGSPCTSLALSNQDPYSALNYLNAIENYDGNTCGDINVEFPFYDDSTTCHNAAVKKAMKNSVDIPSFSVAAILGLVFSSPRLKSGFNRVLLGLTESTDPSPLRATGPTWKYRKDIVLQKTAGVEGYFFGKVPCKQSDGVINASADETRPSLLATALVMNTALITYGEFAVQNSVPGGLSPNQWPITPDMILAHLDAFAETLQLTTVAQSYIQEYPSTSSDDETFTTSSASHAVVLHVINYVLVLKQNGYLTNVSSTTILNLQNAVLACEKHIELSCQATTDNSNPDFGEAEPLVEGFEVFWPPSSSSLERNNLVKTNEIILQNNNNEGGKNESTNDPSPVSPSSTTHIVETTTTATEKPTTTTTTTTETPPPTTSTTTTTTTTTTTATPGPTTLPPTAIRAKSSKTTSIFLAAVPASILVKYCKQGLGADAYRIADHLFERSLRKFGLQKPNKSSDFPSNLDPVFDTYGIRNQKDQGNNCTVDVEETAWLNLGAKVYNRLEARGSAYIVKSLKTSPPLLRTYCRGDHNHTFSPLSKGLLSSWQDGQPVCGAPIPSTTLTSLTAAVLLDQAIFRNPPKSTGTPSPGGPQTPSPNSPNNNDGGDSDKAHNIEQAIIGIVFAVVIMVGVFCTVKYLRKQAHHRFARLEGGMVKGDRPPSDLGYGTYSQVTSNTFM